jgi:hypothetical protein
LIIKALGQEALDRKNKDDTNKSNDMILAIAVKKKKKKKKEW